jgi:hypothetical protein
MIAGAAKSRLAEYKLSIGLPTVICGKGHSIKFPPEATPISIPFESELGTICIEVGLVESPCTPPTVDMELKQSLVDQPASVTRS